MKQNISLCLFHGDEAVQFVKCLSFSLEREIYTPFDSVTAEFLSDGSSYTGIDRIALYADDSCIFSGLVDYLQQYHKQNRSFVRIKSRSFTSLLTQNELPPGLHGNLTMHSLMTNFYQFPHITYDNPEQTEYIFVKSGNTMWDGIVSFGYKITGHYPYVTQNHIHLLPPQEDFLIEFDNNQILESGICTDSTKLISDYHMENITGTADSYHETNPQASAFQIVRHKHIAFDQSFMYAPERALTFRNLYSCRGCQSNYLLYDGFQNIMLGQRITFSDLIQNQILCRINISFGTNGFRTKLFCYHDGFYN